MVIFNIKKIRREKGISVKKLSIKTGISKSYLIELENNKRFNPTVSMLEKIAKELSVNIKDLFYSLNDLEILLENLYENIDKYGVKSNETLEISNIINTIIDIILQDKLKNI